MSNTVTSRRAAGCWCCDARSQQLWPRYGTGRVPRTIRATRSATQRKTQAREFAKFHRNTRLSQLRFVGICRESRIVKCSHDPSIAQPHCEAKLQRREHLDCELHPNARGPQPLPRGEYRLQCPPVLLVCPARALGAIVLRCRKSSVRPTPTDGAAFDTQGAQTQCETKITM